MASPPTYLQAVSMHKHLGHCVAPHINVLDLLRGNVLALGQLEDVLLPVHDLQGAVLVSQRAKSAPVNSLDRCHISVVVALKRAAKQNFLGVLFKL